MMTRHIPKVFFGRMSEGPDLFVDCLGFKILHQNARTLFRPHISRAKSVLTFDRDYKILAASISIRFPR